MNIKYKFLNFLIYRAFTNPIFYISAIIFNIFCSLNFFVLNNFFAGFSTDFTFFFQIIPFISIIIVPILCINSKNLENLVLPIKTEYKILFSIFVLQIQLFFCFLPQILVLPFVNLFGFVDLGQFFLSTFGIILYFLLVSSFSVLIFEIFNNNLMISIIISTVFLGIFTFSNNLIRIFFDNKFLSSIFKFFSFSWHFNSFSKGIFDSKDFFYFIILSFIFYFSAVLVNFIQKGKIFSKSQKFNILFLFLILILSLLNSNQYYFRKDFTKFKKYSISNYTKELISSADEKIQISYYLSSELKSIYPNFKDIEEFLLEFESFKNIDVKILNPDENDSKILENYSVFPQQIRKNNKNKTEFLEVFSAIILEKSGEIKTLPFVSAVETLEYEICFNIQSLISKKSRILNIISGNSFNFDENYSYLYNFLNSQGFSVKLISLKSETFYDELTSSNLTLVLGQEQFSQKNCADLENYMLNGNKVLFAVNPYNLNFDDWKISEPKSRNLIEMIESYGLFFSSGIINDISCVRVTMESYENVDGTNAKPYRKQINYPFWIEILPQPNALSGLTLFWPCAINLNENSIPLLQTSSYSYLVNSDFTDSENLFETNVFDVEKKGYNPTKQEQKSFPVAALFSGQINSLYNNSNGNIEFALISDSLFLSDLMLGYIGENFSQLKNLNFIVNFLLKLNGENELAVLQEKSNNINLNGFYKITEEEKFNKLKSITEFTFFILIPVFYIILYLISFISKKNFITKKAKEICS